MHKSTGVSLSSGVLAHTKMVWAAISRATDIITARGPCLHDMCSLSRTLCTVHHVGMQVMENMKKLTPENQKELDL